MRIGFVAFTDFPEGSAAARRVHMLAKGLSVLGHEVHVLLPQRFRPGPLQVEYDGFQVHWGSVTTASTGNILRSRLSARPAIWRLLRHQIALGLDWLVLYNLGLDALPLIVVARQAGVQIATEYCDLRTKPTRFGLVAYLRYFWQTAADMFIPRLSNLNIVISCLLERRLKLVAPATPTLIIPPLVDSERFRLAPDAAADFKRRWTLDDRIVISYLGGFSTIDGIGVLLRAADELKRAGESFKLVISGKAITGVDCDDVPDLVEALGLQEDTVLTGWLGIDQVIAAMSAADILVVPKNDHLLNQAGFPTKIAEYLAMGKAVVTSKVGDIPLYLENGKEALLCEPGNAHDLARALHDLLSDLYLRGRLGKEARAVAERSFDYRSAGYQIESALVANAK